jgi:hypothetical protein
MKKKPTTRQRKRLRQKNNNNNKTIRKNIKRQPENVRNSRLVKTFLEILHAIKLYHWKTKSFSQHKATDELHEKLAEQTDRFIEVLLGKTASRIEMVEHKITLYDFDSTQEFKHKLFEFRQFLIDLREIFPSDQDTDLMTIKDEMLESVNQFLYILTLS